MSASNYLENELLDHLLGTGAWTSPTNVYIALHTADPGEDCTTATATETTTNNRKVATFSAASGGSAALASTVSWTNVAASETYTHWSLWDAATHATGNPLVYGTIEGGTGVAVTSGDNFDLTALSITLG